jgi:hypothetical protein
VARTRSFPRPPQNCQTRRCPTATHGWARRPPVSWDAALRDCPLRLSPGPRRRGDASRRRPLDGLTQRRNSLRRMPTDVFYRGESTRASADHPTVWCGLLCPGLRLAGRCLHARPRRCGRPLLRHQRNRRARNSPSSFHVWPSGSSASPSHRNESGVISVKVHRVGVPFGRAPAWTMSAPIRRPICSS